MPRFRRFPVPLAPVLFFALPILVSAGVPCDIGNSGTTNVADVQTMVNQVLGAAAPANDLNQDGLVNVVDVQIEINAALGLGCSAPASPPIVFAAPGNQLLGISPFAIAANAVSGRVTFNSFSPAVCGIAGNLVALKEHRDL